MTYLRKFRNPVRILRAARDLIKDKSRWTTMAMARDEHGHPCSARDERAVKFCSLGAIDVVSTRQLAARKFLDYAALKMGRRSPSNVNDFARGKYNRYTNVMEMFDRAILIAQAKEA